MFQLVAAWYLSPTSYHLPGFGVNDLPLSHQPH